MIGVKESLKNCLIAVLEFEAEEARKEARNQKNTDMEQKELVISEIDLVLREKRLKVVQL